jgi:hypothetical protein
MDVSAFVVSNPHASGGLLLGMIFWGMVSASRCVAPAQEAAEPQVEIISEDRVAPGYPPTVPVHSPSSQEAIGELHIEVQQLRSEMDEIVNEVQAQEQPR